MHGLAFAGILSGLGLEGATSLLALLAFNLGIELAQLLTVALVLPSLHVLSRTRAQAVVRPAAAGLALLAATGWAGERLGVLGRSPLAPVEEAAVAHPLVVVAGLAALAGAALLADRRRRAPNVRELAAAT